MNDKFLKLINGKTEVYSNADSMVTEDTNNLILLNRFPSLYPRTAFIIIIN